MIGIDTKIKRGSGELAILALLDQEPLHGYEISKRIAQVTDGVLQFNLASLYPLLYRMEKRGWVNGKMGKSQKRAQAPLLPPDAQRQEATGAAARGMGSVFPGAAPRRGGGPCLMLKD